MKGFYHSVYTFFNGLRFDEPEIQPPWFHFLIYSSARSQLSEWAQQKGEAHPSTSPPSPPRLGCISVLLYWCDPHAYMRTVIWLPFVLCLHWIPLCLLPLNHDGVFFVCVCVHVRVKEKWNRAKATQGGWLRVFTNSGVKPFFLHNILVCIRLSPLYVFYYVLFEDVM